MLLEREYRLIKISYIFIGIDYLFICWIFSEWLLDFRMFNVMYVVLWLRVLGIYRFCFGLVIYFLYKIFMRDICLERVISDWVIRYYCG